MTSRYKLAAVAAGAAVLGLGAAIAGIGPLARYLVIAEARAMGFEITAGDIAVGWGSVKLEQPHFRLTGVSGVDGSASRIRVVTSGLTLKSVELDDPRIDVAAPAATALGGLVRWSSEHRLAATIAVEARRGALALRTSAGAPPWLTADNVEVNPVPATPSSETAHATTVTLAGRSLPLLDASWQTGADGALTLSVGGNGNPANAKLRIALPKAPAQIADLVLEPQPVDDWAAPLGVKLPTRDVIASAAIRVSIPQESAPRDSPLTGSMSWRLHGWVPPHPRELDGIVFGTETTFDSTFELAQDMSTIELAKAKLAAGAFIVEGDGTARLDSRPTPGAQLEMSMHGDISCSALATSAAKADVGGAIGALVGAAARAALGGSVAVTVKLDADSRDLAGARVQKTIGVGCGLKPL